MGLASALSTALTGMNAAETTIDVVGNNLANSSTVGFKESEANFATQFLQTRSLGSAPTDTSGGTNPRQVGLGVLVAEITPDFTQGTIEISSSPSDLAIQGDGFFIVEASSGEQLYTRNGIFKTNSENDLVSISGNRLLGYGVDDDFNIQQTSLVPLNIPLGSAAVAEATENVRFTGILSPTGEVADTAEIIESAVMGDGSYAIPDPVASGGAVAPSGNPGPLNGSYTYYITFTAPGQPESRPVRFGSPVTITNSEGQLTNLPAPAGVYAGGSVAIYRNSATNPNQWRRVDTTTVPPNNRTDLMDDTTWAAQPLMDFNGPRINSGTQLTDVTIWNGSTYTNPFVEGQLEFAATKGGSTFPSKTMQITASSTVQELTDFMTSVFGIHTAADDPGMPLSVNEATGGTIAPDGYVDGLNGVLRFVGNNGVDNALSVDTAAFRMTSTTGAVTQPVLSFDSVQDAVGQSAITTTQVYDSLGIPLDLRITTALESTDGTTTTYRWFAESSGNDPATGIDITVGTGLLRFDGNGNLIDAGDTTVSIDRANIASVKPLEIELDFSNVSALSVENSTLNATFRDGFAAGTLSSYIVGEDGVIRGVFTNGATRTLGQLRLARFSNPAGLEARGENTFALGVNSGLPIEGNPGEQGIGEIIAGATELSNTDIGKNLIDLILASTMYRGNTRVITTSQQLFDELLNLRR
jgi:flagellar hook protein FlgE